MRPHVVIVGGGFGGLACARALHGAHVDVTLVDRTNHHLFQPLLYQVAIAGLSPAEIAVPIRSVLSKQENVQVLLGEVTDISLERHELSIAGPAAHSSRTLTYDHLVLAVGAKTSYFGHDEWSQAAPGLKSLEDAIDIRRRVLTAFERAELTESVEERLHLMTFVVIGGGATGVELAGAIAELAHSILQDDFRAIRPEKAKVILVEAGDRLLTSFDASLSHAAKEQLEELGVEVRLGERVTALDERGVDLSRGAGDQKVETRISSDTVLWGAGVRGTRLGEKLGVSLDRQGRVIVENDCSIPGHPEAFAIGDMAHFDVGGTPLPGLSPVAMQQGRYVARVIRDQEAKKNRSPFRYKDKGTMATIGRSRAIAQTGKMHLTGMTAWLAWLFVHLLFLIGYRNRIVVLFNWAWSYVFYKRGARLITGRIPGPGAS
ncbi:MAG: NAD(P)/FAD-dependent oxidoreductase [Polyangiaceae bacterium]